MSLLESNPSKKYLELIKQFRLIDDTFFEVCLDGSNECMKLLLNIFFERDDIDDIIVKEVVTQRSARNLYERGAQFDVIPNWQNEPISSKTIRRELILCVN